ncbi:hypothetical protein [Granulicella arctica]|uniref:hypothetical protein n=1 Tax=Granulicella arctica TaxID=940613 RepID=UPI0021DF9597|nr:hypothetical protein [Granulicella arctica]
MSESTSEAKKPYQCRHIFTDGHQCGSPALRTQKLCFYHHANRQPAAHKTVHGITFIALPAPDDFHAIQRGLSEVLRLLASNGIDDRHATALIKGLSVCSANLARAARHAKSMPAATELVQEFIQDPLLGVLAPGPEPEASIEDPIPDYTPVQTPRPTVEYTTTPESIALANAQWDAAQKQLAAHAAARKAAGKSEQVQTYPISNQDFGLQKKINPASITVHETPKELATA